MVTRNVLVFLTAVLVEGCTSPPGQLTMHFEWGPDVTPPEPGSVWVHPRFVYEVDGARRDIRGAAGEYQPDQMVELNGVPYGPAIEIIIEMRTGAASNSPLRYIGSSDPFVLQPGDDVTVPVRFRLSHGPTLAATGVRILSHQGAPLLRVGDILHTHRPQIRVEVRARGADKIAIGPKPSFEGFVHETSIVQTDEWTLHEIDYDLNHPEACPAPCEDGSRLLFVRAEAAGADPSTTQDMSLYLDSTAPSIGEVVVTYEPESTNPQRNPNRATVGTKIVVNVRFSEEIDKNASPPTLRVAHSEHVVMFDRVVTPDPGPFRARFESVVTEWPNGRYAPTVTVSDVAQNEASLSWTDPAIVVQRSGPTLLVDQTQVSFVRSPKGNPHPEPLGGFVMPADTYYAIAPPNGLNPSETIDPTAFRFANGSSPDLVRFWANAHEDRLVGEIRRTEDGWPRSPLNVLTPQMASLYASGVDEAGNESERVRLDRTWFVATSHVDADVETLNPTARRFHLDNPTSSLIPDARWSTETHLPSAPAADRFIFEPQARSLAPPIRSTASMAYDSHRGRMVLFGGWWEDNRNRAVNNFHRDDTWEWDGQRWHPVDPPVRPPARSRAAMVFDSRRGRTVLFGGYNGATTLNDTWEWDGQRWQPLRPDHAPAPRSGHAMVYDSVRGVTVMFGGGLPLEALHSDTWEWDGEDWRLRTWSSTATPAARDLHRMVFDARRNRVVMYGGRNWDAGRVYSDTWELDESGWHEVQPNSAPGPRLVQQMVAIEDRVLMFGGVDHHDYLNPYLFDLWTWDGTGWTQVENPPPGLHRGEASLAYDHGRQRLVMFGGDNVSGQKQNDTWEWPLQNEVQRDWQPTNLTAAPPPRMGHAAAYDPARRQMVVFGGSLSSGISNETWAWNGRRWTELQPARAPGPRALATMVYSQGAQASLLFGGWDDRGQAWSDETWTFDGQDWTRVTTSLQAPPARGRHAAAYDTQRDRMVVFGGGTGPYAFLGDTWVFEQGQWRELPATGAAPPARTHHQLAYDAHRDCIVLFGGKDFETFSDTWELHGNVWRQIPVSSDASPPARHSHAMTYDPHRRQVILIGGEDRARWDDVWAWNGTQWTPIDVNPRPARRTEHTLVFDEDRERMVLFGGSGQPDMHNDTWEILPNDPRTAQQLFALIPRPFEDQSVEQIVVRAACRGTSDDGQPGAELFVWTVSGSMGRSGAWQKVAENQAGQDDAQASLMAWTSPDAADHYWVQRDRMMAIQCRPKHGRGTVMMDYAEIRSQWIATDP